MKAVATGLANPHAPLEYPRLQVVLERRRIGTRYSCRIDHEVVPTDVDRLVADVGTAEEIADQPRLVDHEDGGPGVHAFHLREQARRDVNHVGARVSRPACPTSSSNRSSTPKPQG
jgi:hypothetical protein